MITFKNPEQKKNKCYISECDTKIILNLNEIKIKNIQKLANSKGFILECNILKKLNQDTINNIIDIDNTAYDSIIKNNQLWFKNKLENEEINKLYNNSFQKDTNRNIILLNDGL